MKIRAPTFSSQVFPEHGAIRLLPLDRIASLEVLDNTFQSNQDEAVDAILAKSFDLDSPILTKVVIRFSAKLAGLIKNKQFSLLQRRADAADGSCTLTIVTSSPNDLVRYVLSCGPVTLRYLLLPIYGLRQSRNFPHHSPSTRLLVAVNFEPAFLIKRTSAREDAPTMVSSKRRKADMPQRTRAIIRMISTWQSALLQINR